jgi:hypothetical protein
MIILELNWEENLKALWSGRHWYAVDTKKYKDSLYEKPARSVQSVASRIKEINKMIAAGTAVYREVKEKFFTVKDYTINQEFTYPTMDQAQVEQERRVIVLGHDAEVL